MRHGATGYSNQKCRCEEICKPGWAAYMREYRKRRRRAGMPLLEARRVTRPALPVLAAGENGGRHA